MLMVELHLKVLTMAVRMITWNCNGPDGEKLTVIRSIVSTYKLNLVLLIETHRLSVPAFLSGFNAHTEPQTSNNNSGIIILHHNSIKIDIIKSTERFIHIKLKIKKHQLELLAIYGPTNNKNEWWKTNYKILQNIDILAGDFNFILRPEDRKSNKLYLNNDTKQILNNELNQYTDSAIHRKKDHIMTYRNISRIDRVYYNNKKLDCISYKVLCYPHKNDHKMLINILNIRKAILSDRWKFNYRIIEDEIIKSKLKDAVNSINSVELDPIERWITVKQQIISKLKKEEKIIIKRRKKKFFMAIHLMEEYPKSANRHKWKNTIKGYLEDFKYTQRMWIHCRESRAGERPSFWITSKINKVNNKFNIKELKDKEGIPTKNKDKMKQIVQEFYQDLYKSISIDEEKLHQMLNYWDLPDSNLFKDLCNPIDEQEVRNAIFSTSSKKSPGEDGLSIAAYKLLENHLITLTECLQNMFLKGTVPSSWKRGIIVLIFKKGEQNDISNYRPITLLNNDYKLLCKILATRLNRFITDIIPNYQIGFMPKRLIFDNVITLDHLLSNSTKVLNLDFKKAYDSVSHDSIEIILQHLKFPEQFVKIVRGLLSESTAKLIVNGEHTEPFQVERGVKQGDPLSPLLFTFAVELLARCANDKQMLNKFPYIGKIKVSHIMYADDTCLFSTDEDGLNRWFIHLDNLKQATGLEVNMQKTFTIHQKLDTLKLLEEDEEFTYLGFEFNSKGIIDSYDRIVEKTIKSIEDKTNPSMNIFMKLCVLKGYMLPKITYKGFLLGKNYPNLDNAISEFLWSTYGGSKRTLVSKDRRVQPLCHGGLGIPPSLYRANSLGANMFERIVFNKEMKAYQLINLKEINLRKLAYSKCKKISQSKIIQSLFVKWRATVPDEENSYYGENNEIDHFSKYHTVQEIQFIYIKKCLADKFYYTDKQLGFKARWNINIRNIFLNVNNIDDTDLRDFCWKYFQGALFGRKEKKCCNEELDHKHFFYTCKQNQCYRNQANRLFEIIHNNKKSTAYKESILWNEQTFWCQWNVIREEDDFSPETPMKEIMAIYMRTMYLSNLKDTKDNPIESVNKLVNAQLIKARNIRKVSERYKQIQLIKDNWNLDTISTQHYYYYQVKTSIIRSVNRNSPTN